MRFENVQELDNKENFIFLNQDVTESIDSTLKYIDIIPVCPASPINYQKDPIKTNKTSFRYYNLFDFALKNNSKFLMLQQVKFMEIYCTSSRGVVLG